MSNLWLLPDDEKWAILEAVFSVPVPEREALLMKLLKDPAKAFLGTTDKTAPELAVEFIKKGVNARSYAKRNDKV